MADLPVATDRRVHLTSLLVGLVALTAATLTLLDEAGAAHVDEAVTAGSLLLAAGLAGLARSVLSLVRLLTRRRLAARSHNTEP